MASESLIGFVPDDWEQTTLGEICNRGGGGIQTGPFGSQLHASDYVPVGIPSIMPQNIGDNRIVIDGIARITTEDAERLTRYRVNPGDVIYSRRGDVERRALIRDEHEGWLCGTGCLRVRFGKGAVDPLFASYYLGHPSVREWIARHAVGATMLNLNTSILSALPFVAPSLSEQEEIAKAIGVLDDKIELNRQMNATLEAMAQALFKSWFVDFDPVKAKAEGRAPEGMDAATAALFPSEFQDSELGLIPKGWDCVTLGDMVEVKHGYAYQSEYFRNEPPGDILLTPGNFAIGGGFKADKFKYYEGPCPDEYVLDEKDLLVTMTDLSKASDTLGYPALVPVQREGRYLHNQRLGKILIKSPDRVSKMHLYYLLRSENYRNEVLAGMTGTTVKHTSPGRIKNLRFVLPENDLSLRFGEMVEVFYDKQSANNEQSYSLSQIRDALLPKLISGQLRIPAE